MACVYPALDEYKELVPLGFETPEIYFNHAVNQLY